MTAPKTPVEWLEADYDTPCAFRYPIGDGLHTPFGLLQTKPDHRDDCLCETGQGEIWLRADVAAKWRGGDR